MALFFVMFCFLFSKAMAQPIATILLKKRVKKEMKQKQLTQSKVDIISTSLCKLYFELRRMTE